MGSILNEIIADASGILKGNNQACEMLCIQEVAPGRAVGAKVLLCVAVEAGGSQPQCTCSRK